jgi:DDE superfamily endonuclease
MLLVPIPWAGRVGGLPFLTVLASSERSAKGRKRRFKPLTMWARQMIRQVPRWAPHRPLVVVGDRPSAALELLAAIRSYATLVTRLRLDARLFAPAPLRSPHQQGRPRLVGERLPTLTALVADPQMVGTPVTAARWYREQKRPVAILAQTAVWYSTGFPPVPIRWILIRDPRGAFKTHALLCTDLSADPSTIVSWVVLRWQVEVTFHEARAHLGMETQRHWSPRAITRTPPALLGLFSLGTLVAHPEMRQCLLPHLLPTAWYPKLLPTFSDALALVRRHLWTSALLQTSRFASDPTIIPRALLEHLRDLLCYAA